ncbi:MAG TPA: ankyrin repeat domain-containing protein [Thermoanaerobaculia bacterium]|jgi:ankyrin repeat protein|nr:ankyrin repeat domain-containing protein [Thermoanaerobaculia bacterium]
MQRLIKATFVLVVFFACRGGRFADGVQADLIDAARGGDVRALQGALARGASPNAIDDGPNGWTPLLHAIHKGQAGSVTALLDAGADPNRSSREGTTPLTMAAGYGYAPIVREPLHRGADPSLANARGETARDLALTGVTDIDRFTYFSCQDETAALLANVKAQKSALRWAKMKRCATGSS